MDRRQRRRIGSTFLGTCLIACLHCETARAAETTAGVGLGATAGAGVQADLTLHRFTRDVPLSLRLAAAYSGRDAGLPLDARRVFINNNTNGTPQESGHAWQLRLDLAHPVAHLGAAPVNLALGVRKAFFTATFDYVGGNENFDVTSRPWGLGVVLDTALVVGQGLDFTLALGLDYFFPTSLEGHDTAYSPDEDNVNAQEDYAWDDANAAVNQPELEWLALVGLRWRLGS